MFAEQFADALFELGKDQIQDGKAGMAEEWLGRAQDVLAAQNMEDLSGDASELNTSILHYLVKCHMMDEGEHARSKARNVLHELEATSGDGLAVSILKLDLLKVEPDTSPEEFSDILLKIIRTMTITDEVFKTILHYTHDLRRLSPILAHIALKVLLMERLLDLDRPDWLDRVIVTMIWNSTTCPDTSDQECFSKLKSALDLLIGQMPTTVCVSATHASQMVSQTS